MNLEERCQDLLVQMRTITYPAIQMDRIRAFAREIRNDALQEALTVMVRIPATKEAEEYYWIGCNAVLNAIKKLKDTNAPEAKESEK